MSLSNKEKKNLEAIAKLLEVYALSEKVQMDFPHDPTGEAEKVYIEMAEFLREVVNAH